MAPPNRIAFVAMTVAAISVGTLVWCWWEPPPPHPPLKVWLQSTHVAGLTRCPGDNDTGPDAFSFYGKIYQWCGADGPYKWNGMDWYVQRIDNLSDPVGGPRHDVVRVCSPQAKRAPSSTAIVRGPCGTAAGTAYGGCEICVVDGGLSP